MKKENPPFQIIMATYNGEKYIDIQIKSIMSQIGHGELLIHDDGSSDKTLNIIKSWVARDRRITLIEGEPCGGAKENFAFLLRHTSAHYVFFADQDDIWEEDKIKIMLDVMSDAESNFGYATPILIHSDLSIIDDSGNNISHSLMRYQKLNPTWTQKINLIMTENVVTGCACLVNRALIDVASPIPNSAVMHDWWLAINAAMHGKTLFINRPTVKYRRHASNVVGAQAFGPLSIFKRMLGIFKHDQKLVRQANDAELAVYNQAQELYLRFPDHDTLLVKEFYSLSQKGSLLRLISILRFKFFQSNSVRNIVWMIRPRLTLYKLEYLLRRRRGHSEY